MTIETYQNAILARAGKVREAYLYWQSRVRMESQFKNELEEICDRIKNRRVILLAILGDKKLSNQERVEQIYQLFDLNTQKLRIQAAIKENNKDQDNAMGEMKIRSAELINFVQETEIEAQTVVDFTKKVNIEKETIGEK